MIVHGRLYKSLAFAISISLILSLIPLPVWGGLRQPGTALAHPLLDVLPSQLASSPDSFAPHEMLLNADAMQEAADGVQDAPPALAAPLSVSRVQSTYQAAGTISGSLVITFTVTNNMPPAITPVLDPEATVTETIEAVAAFDFSADPNVIRNVLLVDELLPSQATFISAAPHPDRSDNSLVGNLGDIPPLGSVTLILSLTVPPSVPDFTDLDTGAIAWGTLQGRAVSASTAPITLAPDGLEDWFACTLDANCHDEYVIKKAAELGNDPAAIFEYVRSLGYESYKGSLRGARGTLWSAAANAMDQASLLIALLRASGIPAAYRHGGLDDALAQELILSMFPAAQGIAGYVPEGDSVADPANDPQLLEESRDHWWVEAYLPGTGWTHLDPSFSGAQIGESFVPAPEPARLVQVPDSLRHKVTLKVEIETYHVFSALYSDGLLHTYPLTHTFNSVELVGNPVSLSHLVDTTYRGGLISAYTHRTYVPSFTVGDQIIEGEPFDDFMSSLWGPLVNYFTTGEWLVFEMRDTEGNVETSRREIADLLGFENRQAGGVIQFGFDLTEMPSIVNEQSLYTTLIAPSEVPASAINASYQQLVAGFSEGEAALGEIQALIDSGGPAEEDLPRMREAKTTLEQAVRLGHRTRLLNFAAASDLGAERLGRSLLVKPYYDSPRILIISGERDAANETNTIMFDLHRDTIRTVAYPGQSLTGVQTFNFVRGLAEMTLEASLLQGFAPEPVISVHTVLQQALTQGVPLVMITPANLVDLANLDISEEAKARIVAELRASPSKFVIVPASSVTIGAQTTIGWLLVDVITGETIDVMENGQHIAAISYALILNGSFQELIFSIVGFGHGFAAYTFAFLVSIMGMMPFTEVDLKTTWTLALAEASSYTDLIVEILEPAAKEHKWINAYLNGATFTLGFKITIPGFVEGTVKIETTVCGFKEGVKFAKTLIDSYVDPPLPSALFMRLRQPPNVPVLAVGSVLAAATSADTVVEASLALVNFSATGDLSSSWSSEAQYALAFEQLDAAGVTLYAEDGTLLDSGTASARPAKDLAWALTAARPATLAASGEESISFYAPALAGLAAGTQWITGAAQLTPTQPYTLTLQGALVTMNGANAYIGDLTLVTPESITIQGVGPLAAPHFAGSTTLQASGANLQFGPATLLAGSLPFSTANGAALAGYTGDIAIAEATSSTDQVEFTGNASFFTLDLSPAATTTDPHTPLTFQAAISANFDDTYTLTVEAPPGWELTVGESGLITATPPLGAAPGDYSLLVTAQSGAYPDLFVSAVHTVTTVAHQGVSLGVNPDLQFTIPWGPADPNAAPGSTNNGQIQLPDAAFSIDITNTSTVSHTFEVLVTGLSSNWLIFGGSEGQTATALTLPAGGIGQVGLYISPTLPLPAAGTPYAFEVTATAVDDPALSQGDGETFIVPAIAFNYLVVTPPVIYASPHTTATFDIALTNVGNVTGNFPLNVTLPVSTWAQISTLQSPISLAAGETQTQSVSLAIPGATLGRSYAVRVNSPAPGTPYTQTASVNVQLVSANTLPIYRAAEEAAELFPGDLSLPAVLNFLGQAISDLDSSCQDGACGLDLRDRVVSGARAVANHAEPVLALVTADESLRQIAAAMASHTDAADLLADTAAIRDAVETLLVKLQAVAHHGLEASFTPGLVAALDDGSTPAEYVLHVTNEGSLATTAVMTLTPPAGASASWANLSVSLQPGELVTVATLITATTQGIFTVQADVAAAEAALISRQAQAHLAVVDAFLQIGNVIATPTFVEYQSGLAVTVYADVSNLINLPIAGNARLQAVAADGTQVYSGTTPVVVASSIAPLRINLGYIDTAGLVTGTYTLTVSIFDEGGAVIPEATGQGILAIGQAVEASSRVSPEVVAPGDATVETIIDTELSDDVLDLGGGKLLYKLAQLPITGTAVSLVVSGVPTPTVAGTSYPLTVIAYDIFGNVAISYTGAITFTNSDPQATLPVTYTFVASDGGQHTFPVIFGTPGEQSVSVTDVDDPTLTDTLVTNVSVGPVDVNNTQLSASSLHHADGIEASLIVITATDSFNNGIPGAIVWVRPSGTENHVRDYPGTTDANGVFTTTLTSTKPEYKVLNVLVGDGQTMRWLPSPLLIEFTGVIITGTVFSDPNRDNVQQPGESGLGGVQTNLYRGAETTPLKQTVTQSDGRYSFTGLVSGAYRVEQTRLGEYAFSDSGVLTVTVNDFATIANIDFGNYDAAQATGRVWNDGNQDGLRQAGEPGLPGVTMSLYDTNNQLVDSTTTDASGDYRLDLIADLPAAPSNFTFSSSRFRLQEPAAAIASNADFSFTRIPLDSSTYPVNYDFMNTRITLPTSTYPINYDFMNTRITLPTSTYPLNYDFTDGRTALLTTTYPANYDFSSGDLGGWTPSNPGYVQVVSNTANLDGPHLWIGRYNHWAESASFTVPAGTQSLRFNYQNYGRYSTSGAYVYVYARSGPDFSTSTSLGGFSGTSAQGWREAVADLQAFQGQSIKLRFVTGNDGYARSRIDNIGLYIETPDWKPATTSHGYVQIVDNSANLDGPHLWIGRYNHWAESAPFTVPTGTQSLRFNYQNYGRYSTSGAYVYVYARSGPDFSTSTSLGGFSGTSAQGWREAVADLQAFQGQSIKLRFVTGNDGYARSRIDNIGLYIETPDWKPATTSHGYVQIVDNSANLDGPHLWIGRYNHWAESAPFTVPTGTQSLRFNYQNYGRYSTSGANVYVYARSGPDFSTSTSLGGFSGTSAQGWREAVADLQAFQGQSIKLRFVTGNDGYARSRIDNIGLYIETPDWKPATTSHGYVRIISSTANLDGPHLWIGRYNHWAESAPFTVPAETQSLRFNYHNYGRYSTSGAYVYVYARSGPDFSASTLLGGFSGTSAQGWRQAVADLQAFQGQSIKLRFVTGNDGYARSRIDNVGLYIETPDWKPATTSHGYVQVVNNPANLDGPHLWIGRYNHWAESAPFTVPAETQSLRFNYHNYGRYSTSGAYVYVYARSGPDFSTSTSLGGFSGTSSQGWRQAVADLQAFQGQTIKLRFITGNDGYARSRIDNVGLYIETPDWKPATTSHGYVQIVNNPANLDGPHLWIGRYNHWAESAPFAVPTETQSLRFNYHNYGRYSTSGAYVYVYARSGPDFSASTSLGGFSGTSAQGWRQATANLQAFQGQTIKLRFVTGNDSYDNDRSRIDNVYLLPLSTTPYTITEINLPNHTSTTPDTVSVDAYGGAAFNIDFGDFSVDRFNSTVQVSPTVLVADGVSTAVVTVTLHDNSNNPLPGYTVEISAPGTGVTVTQSLNPTNASGQAVGTIRATCAPQNVLVTARSVSDNTTLDQSVPITIIPGPPDVEHFTFVAAPTKVVANGVDAALFTVTLRDQYDNPISGHPVTITHDGTAISLTLDFTQTNVLGQVTGNVRSTAVQTVTLQAHTAGLTLTQVITLGFAPGQADPTNSTSTILPATVLADGVQTATITVTLRDALNHPLAHRPVELIVSGSANTITPAGQAQTDAGGVIVFSLASSAVETKQVSVRDVDYGVTLPAGQVDFVPGPTDVAASQLQADVTTVIADGVSYATLTATLYDSYGHPAPDKATIIQVTGANITVTQPSTTTNVQGSITATLKSTDVQTVTVTAFDQTDGLTLTQVITLGFVPGQADPTNSTSTILPATVLADGVQTAAISVTLRDALNHPLAHRPVELIVSGSANTITPAGQAQTDAGGVIVFSLASSAVETKQVSVRDVDYGVTLPAGQVDFVPGPTDVAASQLQADVTTVIADGVSYATLTATLYDSYGHPAPDKATIIQVTGANITVTQPSTTTNVQGSITATLKSTDVQTVTVTAFDQTDGLTLTQVITLGFVPGQADPTNSTSTILPATVLADGVQTAAISVTLCDALSHPLAHRPVELIVSGSYNTITPAGQAQTDAGGVIVFSLASSAVETKQVSVRDVDYGVTLPAGQVDFVPGPVDAASSTLSASSASAPADGTSPITVTVRLLDAMNNPISGISVTLVTGGAGVNLTQPAAPSDPNGHTSGSLAGSVAETVTVWAVADGHLLDAVLTLDFVGPDLVVSKSGPAIGIGGREVTYTLTVTNQGWIPAQAVWLSDTLPSEISFVRQSSPYTITQNGDVVAWSVGDLEVGQSIQCELVGLVSQAASLDMQLTNQVQAATATFERNTANNLASDSLTVAPNYEYDGQLQPAAQTMSIGGVATYDVIVHNVGNLPDSYNLSVLGLDASWYTLQPSELSLEPGEVGRASLRVQVNDCTAAGTYDLYVLVNSDGVGNTRTLDGQLTLTTGPLISELAPQDGASIGATSALFTWQTAVSGTTSLSLKPAGDTSFTGYTGTVSNLHRVSLSGLVRNTDYEWFVRTVSTCGSEDSPVRTLRVLNGIEFTQRSYNFSVNRDYNQLVSVAVYNQDVVSHTVVVTIENPYPELIIGFIDQGSIDEPFTLMPGETHNIQLAIHAQDIIQEDFDLVGRLIADDGSAAPIEDAVPIHVHVHVPNFNFSIEEIGSDPHTLIKTYRVTNYGDALTDLAITADVTGTGSVYLLPGMSHGYLRTGQYFTFEAIPSVDASFQALNGVIKATAGGVVTSTAISLSLPDGASMFLGEATDVSMEASTADWYCTNRAVIDNKIVMPAGFRRSDVASAKMLMNFRPYSNVRPHHVQILLNNNEIGKLEDMIPRGLFIFPVDPAFLNESVHLPSVNYLRLNTTHLNGGHYVIVSDMMMNICLNSYREWVAATSQTEADQAVSNRSFLIPAPTLLDVDILSPSPGQNLMQDVPTTIQVHINDDVDQALFYDVTVQADNDNGNLVLYDDGVHGDGGYQDGVYANTWTPLNAGPTTLSIRAGSCTIAGSAQVTVTVTGFDYDVAVTHQAPVTGTEVLTGTFVPVPQATLFGAEQVQVDWAHTLTAGHTSQQDRFKLTLPDMQPGETRQVASGTVISYTGPSGSGSIKLPPLYVTAAHLVAVEPAAQTVSAGARAVYQVSLYNPGTTESTLTLAVAGLPAGWVDLVDTVSLAAGEQVILPLTVTVPAAEEALGEYPFAVTVETATGGRDQAGALLIVAGAPSQFEVAVTPEEGYVANGEAFTYTITLTNLEAVPQTYALSLAGLENSPATLPALVTVAANSTVTAPLKVTAYASHGPHPFAVTATAIDTNVSHADDAVLVVVGDRRVAADLSPSAATGGPGVPVPYTLAVINKGSLPDTYAISVNSPAGWSYQLEANGQAVNSLSLTPYLFNVADLVLLVTPAATATPGDYTFTVNVQSQNNPNVSASVAGTLTVIEYGVQVELLPDSLVMSPAGTGTWQVLVTNTGAVLDTYDLTAGGIISNSAQFSPDTIALAPGQSQTVQLTAGDMTFALPRTYPIKVTARSLFDNRIQNHDTANLTFTGYEAVEVGWIPDSRVLTDTLEATYMLLITNTGNVATVYDLSVVAPLPGVEVEVEQVYIPPHMTAGVLVRVRAAEAGAYLITGQADSTTSAASGSGTATLIVEDSAVSRPPAALADTCVTLEDTPVTISVLDNDTDPDGDPLTVISSTLPLSGTAVINLDNTVTYAPTADFYGTDNFSYTISDDHGGTATAAVTVTVTPINDAPLALDDAVTTDEDTPVTIDVLANDSDVDGDSLALDAVSQAANGTISVNLDSTLTYTPTVDFYGTDNFSYTISDSHGSTATATISLNVTSVNDIPVTADDTVTTDEDTPVTIDVLANDTDADSDSLTAISTTPPLNGALIINPDNTLTYTPVADFHGTDSFTYTVDDGHGGTATATVTVSVTSVNDAPLALDDAVTTDEDTPVTIDVLSNDSDVDGDSLALDAVSQAVNGTISVNLDSTLTYTPTADFYGTDSFSYTISDGNGGVATAMVSITVSPVNDVPVAADDSVTAIENITLTIDVLANDTDRDGDSLGVSAVTQAANGTVTINPDNTLAYTSAPGFYGGTDTFTYTVSDSNGGTDTAMVVVTVVPAGNCGELYPIAMHVDLLANVNMGDYIDDVYGGVQPGNFGWMSWTGDPSEGALVTALTPPGSSSDYVNPYDPSDHIVSVGDWVPGMPGVSTSDGVRAALDGLMVMDITIPVWDLTEDTGNNTHYRIVDFAVVRLTDYYLPNENRISVRFMGLAALCKEIQ